MTDSPRLEGVFYDVLLDSALSVADAHRLAERLAARFEQVPRGFDAHSYRGEVFRLFGGDQ